MKPNIYILLIIIIFNSCKKASNDGDITLQVNSIDSYKNKTVYTIKELEEYENIDSLTCHDKLPHERDSFYIKGYIWRINLFPDDSRLLLYSEMNNSINEVFNGEIIETKIVSNQDAIFKTLENFFNNNDTLWTEAVVKANIESWTMMGNGWCKLAISLGVSEIRLSTSK